MLKVIFLFSVFFSLNAFTAVNNDLFTSKQKQEVLSAIDSICGDTWCEGDYNFDFKSFTCTKSNSTCELKFHFIKEEDNDKKIYSSLQTCSFSGIKNYGQLMEAKFQWHLTDQFYDEVTECIWEKEKMVRF